MIIFDWIIDCFFFIDIIINFNTAIVHPLSEQLITDRSLIAKKYLEFWFWIDLISTIPFDDIINAVVLLENGSNISVIRLIRMIRLTRMLKLIRTFKLGRMAKHFEYLNINPALTGIVQLVGQIFFVAHVLCCFWFFITTDVVVDPSWTTWASAGEFDKMDLTDQYVASFYWVVATMVAVGYGDVHAYNTTERLYSIFTMLLGTV